MLAGTVFLLQPSVRHITETVSGFLPTPQSQMHTRPWKHEVDLLLQGSCYKFRRITAVIFAEDCPELTPGLHLSMAWLELIMGWPIGWTALEPLATVRFQRWCALHGTH